MTRVNPVAKQPEPSPFSADESAAILRTFKCFVDSFKTVSLKDLCVIAQRLQLDKKHPLLHQGLLKASAEYGDKRLNATDLELALGSIVGGNKTAVGRETVYKLVAEDTPSLEAKDLIRIGGEFGYHLNAKDAETVVRRVGKVSPGSISRGEFIDKIRPRNQA